MVIEPEPPDPTLVGFATQGFIYLNFALAARFNEPAFAAIGPEKSAMLAQAWLKFLGYYVTLAKVTGPMGALAAAVLATAMVYGPPAFMTMQRPSMPSQPPGQSPGAGGSTVTANPAEPELVINPVRPS